MKGNKRVRVIISGRVQGVFFRMETKRYADSIGVYGWVKNNIDKTVEAVFEGDAPLVDKAVAWCRKGPPLSLVNHLDVVEEACTGDYADFRITY